MAQYGKSSGVKWGGFKYVSADVLPRVWVNQEPSKISSGTISGLPSLSRQWIRAAAKGSNNTGGWSDPAFAVIP